MSRIGRDGCYALCLCVCFFEGQEGARRSGREEVQSTVLRGNSWRDSWISKCQDLNQSCGHNWILCKHFNICLISPILCISIFKGISIPSSKCIHQITFWPIVNQFFIKCQLNQYGVFWSALVKLSADDFPERLF